MPNAMSLRGAAAVGFVGLSVCTPEIEVQFCTSHPGWWAGSAGASCGRMKFATINR